MLNNRTTVMCNCAGCGKELLGESMRGYLTLNRIPPRYVREIMAGRVNDRPYCADCMPLAEARKAKDGESRSLFSF